MASDRRLGVLRLVTDKKFVALGVMKSPFEVPDAVYGWVGEAMCSTMPRGQ
jgi:hypothetical protein